MSAKVSDMLTRAAATRASSGKGKKSPQKTAGGGIFARLATLYENMQHAYATCAENAGLSCQGCENNCCNSFFQHHTYMEWAYLWRGLTELPPERRKLFVSRAREYTAHANGRLAAGMLPDAMCPLIEDGLCALYEHRLMICRLHGTRNTLTLPDGGIRIFSGCGRFTALPCAAEGREESCPTLDRTPFYRELASLEMEFLKRATRPMPRVDMTLAEMIVLGPPKLR